jgi:hypothetical protein
LIATNGNNGNAVEITPEGRQIAKITLARNGAGDLFGITLSADGHGLVFVNDRANASTLRAPERRDTRRGPIAVNELTGWFSRPRPVRARTSRGRAPIDASISRDSGLKIDSTLVQSVDDRGQRACRAPSGHPV